MYIQQLYTHCLAEAAYYIESEGIAIVIDPIREPTPYLALAKKRNAKIQYIFETHIHADFVSGHLDLAKKTNATIVFGPGAKVHYPVHVAEDEEVFQLGKITIQVLHTPGHTLESTCYLLYNEQGKAHALFTGDTLFVGDVGRPDLLEDTLYTKEHLAGMLYESIQKKIMPLSDDIILYPGHGPGSACGKNIGNATFSTIGVQRSSNYALQTAEKADFIQQVTQDLLPPPHYFIHNARLNQQGYISLDDLMQKSCQPLSLQAFQRALAQGSTLIDTRDGIEFAKKFIPQSLNISLKGQYAIWMAKLCFFQAPIILVTASGKEEESIRRLARVGYDRIKGYLQGGIATYIQAALPCHSIETIQASTVDCTDYSILDVRTIAEYKKGHVQGALHYPLDFLRTNYWKLSVNHPYLLYCGSGYRSMIAASILYSAGFYNIKNISGGFQAIQKTDIILEYGI